MKNKTNILNFTLLHTLPKKQKNPSSQIWEEGIFYEKTIYFTSSKITTTENQYLTFLWYKNEDNLDYFLLIISNQKIFYPAS